MSVTTATFSDENLKHVRTIYGNVVDGDFLSTAILQAKPLGDKNGTQQTYFTSVWNQKWYTFMPSDTAQMSEWIPLVFTERLSNGNVIYEAEVDYVNSTGDYSNYPEGDKYDFARLEIVVDENNKLISNTIKPYNVKLSDDGQETIVFAKTAGGLKIGDQIRFFSQNYDTTTGELFFNQESEFVTLQKAFDIQVEELQFEDMDGNPLDYYYMMLAEDINDNRAFSTLQKAQKDSAQPSDENGTLPF